MYAWAAAASGGGYLEVPTLVFLTLRLFPRALREAPSNTVVKELRQLGEAFWLDAKAQGNSAVVGGWLTLQRPLLEGGPLV